MHGTGDDEKYWHKLIRCQSKTILDNMIAVECQLIVVIPSFLCGKWLHTRMMIWISPVFFAEKSFVMTRCRRWVCLFHIHENGDDGAFQKALGITGRLQAYQEARWRHHSAVCQSLDYFSWFPVHSAALGTSTPCFNYSIQHVCRFAKSIICM